MDNKVKENFKWYAICCVSGKEKDVSAKIKSNIEAKNLNYWVDKVEVPVERNYVFIKGKKTVREKVIMPGYILINADISNGEVLETIKATQNFIGFINPSSGGLTRKGKPEVMKISDVNRFLKTSEENSDPKWKYDIGDIVKITEGAFSTFNARIKSIDDKRKTLDLIVMIFNRETPVTLNFKSVEKIN
jgi:transcriptional antiterminator NusG